MFYFFQLPCISCNYESSVNVYEYIPGTQLHVEYQKPDTKAEVGIALKQQILKSTSDLEEQLSFEDSVPVLCDSIEVMKQKRIITDVVPIDQIVDKFAGLKEALPLDHHVSVPSSKSEINKRRITIIDVPQVLSETKYQSVESDIGLVTSKSDIDMKQYYDQYNLLENEHPLEVSDSSASSNISEITEQTKLGTICRIPNTETAESLLKRKKQSSTIIDHDPFELTLFQPTQRSSSESIKVTPFDSETEMRNIDFELFKESDKINSTYGYEAAHKMYDSDDQLFMRENERLKINKQRHRVNQDLQNANTSDGHSNIPIRQPVKLKFNPKTSAAYVANNRKKNATMQLQEEEGELHYESEITATQLSRVSNKKRIRKIIKEKIEQANQELYEDKE